MSARRWRWSSPKPATRRSTPPSWSRSITCLCPRSRRPRRRAPRVRHCSPTRRRAISASTGGTATPRQSSGLRRSRRMSSTIRLDNHRVVTNPMEPRGIVGAYDPATGRYTAYVSAQSIHVTRDFTARSLGVEPSRVRFVAPDVGGGFGAKNFVYPGACAVAVGREAGRPTGQMDRDPQRSFPRRPPGPRPTCRGVAGARRGRADFLRCCNRQRGQSRRLSRRQLGGGADLPVRVPARHGLPHPGDRSARHRRLHQHRADRRIARPRLWRGQQHHRAADRRGGAAMRLRPRRIAPQEPGAGGGDADDQRGRQPGRQRRVSGDLRARARSGRCRRFRGAAAGERGAKEGCAGSASSITSREPAAIRRRMSISASRRTARCS